MIPADYFDRCARHDWYFEFSDDHGKWSAGRREDAALRDLAAADPVLGAIRSAFALYMFSGEAFGCDRAPLPDRGALVPAGINPPLCDRRHTSSCDEKSHNEALTSPAPSSTVVSEQLTFPL